MNTLRIKILIAGGTGFIGRYLLKNLLEINLYEIHIIHRKNSNLDFLREINNIHLHNVDIINLDRIVKIVKPNIAINLVCSRSEEMYFSNFEFGKLFVDSCITNRVNYFVNTHSLLKSYRTEYVSTKEKLVKYLKSQQDKISIINISPELVLGYHPSENNLTKYLLTQIKSNKKIKIMNGSQKRDFIHISDLTNAYVIILNNIYEFKNFNQVDVASGKLTTIKNFTELFIKVFCEKNKPEVVFNNEEVYDVHSNLNLLKSLGWESKMDLEKGISMLFNNMKT